VITEATPENYRKILNPGRNDLQGIEFFVRRDGSQQKAMSQMVKATTYWEDKPITIEHSIEQLCDKGSAPVFISF
jgi:hypothetical protein